MKKPFRMATTFTGGADHAAAFMPGAAAAPVGLPGTTRELTPPLQRNFATELPGSGSICLRGARGQRVSGRGDHQLDEIRLAWRAPPLPRPHRPRPSAATRGPYLVARRHSSPGYRGGAVMPSRSRPALGRWFQPGAGETASWQGAPCPGSRHPAILWRTMPWMPQHQPPSQLPRP